MSEHPDDDLPEQMRVRREKRERLLADGVEPYPLAVPRTHTLREIRRDRTTAEELEPDTHTGDQCLGHRPGDLPAQHRQALLRPAARGR